MRPDPAANPAFLTAFRAIVGRIGATLADVPDPLDLAVSKISRFAEQDRADITALARRGLIGEASLRRRALEALTYYVGNLDSVKTSIDLACDLVAAARPDPETAPRVEQGDEAPDRPSK